MTDTLAECGKACWLLPGEFAWMLRSDADGYMHIMTAKKLLLGQCTEMVQ